MIFTQRTIVVSMALLPLAAMACASDGFGVDPAEQEPTSSVQAAITGDLTQGAVFVQGDSPVGGNQVYAYSRDSTGFLTFAGAFATGGNGSGLGTVNEGQHSVVRDGNLLFVTNAGPNSLLDLNGSVSVFVIGPTGLKLADVKSTHGIQPLTVARRGNVVVVVNSIEDSLQSYVLDASNHLIPKTHVVLNTNLLHGGALGHPADVVFSSSGTQLIVAERQLPASLVLPDQAWFIDVATVDPNTGAVTNVVNNNVGALGGIGTLAAEPFGLIIAPSGQLVANHGRYELPNGGQEATYTINPDNTLTRTSLVPSGGDDDCWSAIVNSNTPGIQYYYEQSFFDSDIRVATLSPTLGSFSLVANTSPTSLEIPGGVDIGVTSSNGSGTTYLYALNSTPNPLPNIHAYTVDRSTGTLTPIATFGAGQLSLFSVGIAVY
jgi:hypothetical protein